MDSVSEKTVVGATALVDVLAKRMDGSVARYLGLPAKVDTGAASSAIWASNIRMDEDGMLVFCLFDEASPFYTGEELRCEDYRVAIVRSSNGHEELRYKVMLTLVLEGKKVRASVSLADRGRNLYPILIGRRTLAGRFLVDVSQRGAEADGIKRKRELNLNKRMQENPNDFHMKYMKSKNGLKKLEKSDINGDERR